MLMAINSGDTVWALISADLVFLLAFAFVLFYGGLHRDIDITLTLKRCLLAGSLVLLQWVLFGYSLSFGPDHGGWIGSMAWAGLQDVGLEPNIEYAGTIPHQAFMIYHAMVACACSNRDVLENERAIADLLSRQASPLAFDAAALRVSLKALFAWIASTWARQRGLR